MRSMAGAGRVPGTPPSALRPAGGVPGTRATRPGNRSVRREVGNSRDVAPVPGPLARAGTVVEDTVGREDASCRGSPDADIAIRDGRAEKDAIDLGPAERGSTMEADVSAWSPVAPSQISYWTVTGFVAEGLKRARFDRVVAVCWSPSTRASTTAPDEAGSAV